MVAAHGSASAPERSIELLGYRVRVAPWLLEQVGSVVAAVAPAHTVAVITDEHVAPLHLPAVAGSLRHFLPHAHVIVRAIPAGEPHKTRDTWAELTDWMLHQRCGRDTTVVALGGGVVGDLAGFVAATFMRGIPVVQCPTSLLAMVDASVGGKVGVDTPAGKNLVGAFHQPHAVLVDPTALQTLPPDHRRAGLAEVIKHGAIADAGYLDEAVALGATLVSGDDVAWHGERLTALIARSIAIKADVVRQDEREGGVRQVLNFGHTIGHAIEAASGFTLLHGEAIAIGMTCEALLAERLGIAEPGTGDVIERALRAVGLPTQCPPGMPPSTLIDLMRIDKKSRNSRIVFALPAGIGTMARVDRRFGIAVGDDVVLAALSSTR